MITNFNERKKKKNTCKFKLRATKAAYKQEVKFYFEQTKQ
jgi:hypothetical protein